MAKYNITFKLLGASDKIIEAPNTTNPVEAESFPWILQEIADNLPSGPMIECVGITIEKVID